MENKLIIIIRCRMQHCSVLYIYKTATVATAVSHFVATSFSHRKVYNFKYLQNNLSMASAQLTSVKCITD